jgi:arylformamidase
MRRRYFLSGAAALGATAVAPAFGQQKPVFLHYTQEQLDQAYDQMDAASAMRRLRIVNCPVVVANGDRESPEFRRQSTMLADALQGMGRLEARIELFGTNHFQVPQRLSKPDSDLSQLLYALMKI